MTVEQIENRIRTEYEKYKNSHSIDWVKMAAHKIHSTMIDARPAWSDFINGVVTPSPEENAALNEALNQSVKSKPSRPNRL